MQPYILRRSDKPKFKFVIMLPQQKNIYFGASGYEDYTSHKDKDRRLLYVKRHMKRENWTKSGIDTKGFWSYWLLWNEPSIEKAIKVIEMKFNIKIIHNL